MTTSEETGKRTGQACPEWLACPECGAAVENGVGRLSCKGCAGTWPVVDGVPEFVSDFPYWGEMTQERMAEVNRRAREGRWDRALLDFDDAEVRRASEMILNLDRANWHWLVPLPADSRALELGAGTGTNSHTLALHCREVVALEPVKERTDFMSLRFRQEGLDNVTVIRSSLWTLPFAKESFDLVAMNGVLEWVPAGRTEDPRDSQLKALRNARSMLRPGGHLYVGIENRTAAGYFIGYPDPHCGLPWVTVLPRPLAHWYARRKGERNGYRNYLHTAGGYRRLLQHAGFSSVEVYVAAPSYNHPKYLFRLEDNLFSYYSDNFSGPSAGRLRRILRGALSAAGLLKHTEYSYALIARK